MIIGGYLPTEWTRETLPGRRVQWRCNACRNTHATPFAHRPNSDECMEDARERHV